MWLACRACRSWADCVVHVVPRSRRNLSSWYESLCFFRALSEILPDLRLDQLYKFPDGEAQEAQFTLTFLYNFLPVLFFSSFESESFPPSFSAAPSWLQSMICCCGDERISRGDERICVVSGCKAWFLFQRYVYQKKAALHQRGRNQIRILRMYLMRGSFACFVALFSACSRSHRIASHLPHSKLY